MSFGFFNSIFFMNNDFEIYEVKPNETLQQIANRFEMSAEELQAFHNVHYKEVGLMWFSNFVGISKIIIPVNYKSKAERKKEHQQNFPPKQFSKEFYGKKYTVKETFENSYKEISEIDYQLELQINEEKEEIVVQIANKNFTKRKNPVDDKISSIAIACMDAVNPIGFVLDNKGKLKKLAHPEVYPKRFSEKRPSLEDFFVGEVYQNYLDKFQESWKNPENIFEKFRSQLLYQLLFPGMDWFHKNEEWQEKKILISNSFPVNLNFLASYQHEESEFAITEIKGTVAEEVSLQDLLRGIKIDEHVENPTEVLFQCTYFTDKETKKLHSAEAKVTFLMEGEFYSSHHINIADKSN